MKEKEYQQMEQDVNGIKIILEFPLESHYSFKIEQDIKRILFSELQSKIKEHYI